MNSDCTKPTCFQLSHVGSFIILVLLSTLNLTLVWPSFSISLALSTVCMMVLMLIVKIKMTIGFTGLWLRYKNELSLIILYHLICVCSLLVNLDRYSDLHELVKFGITPIIITSVFFGAWILFSLPPIQSGLSISQFSFAVWIPLFYFFVLALFAIWQYVDFESSKIVGQFFVAAEVWPSNNVNGFLRISTDLGSCLAILVVYLISGMAASFKGPLLQLRHFLILALISVVFVAGLCSGARVFIFILLITTMMFIVLVARKYTKSMLVMLMALIVLFHVAMMFLPFQTVLMLNKFLPYLLPLYLGEVGFISDVLPNFAFDAFGERADIWRRAIALILQNPVLGVSNGGFHLSGENSLHNTHTLLLQPLIDSGFLGTFILLILAVKCSFNIYRANNRRFASFVVVAVLSGLLVDFQVDHSLPWIIISAYVLAQSFTVYNLRAVTFECISWPKVEKGALLITFSGLLVVLALYLVRNSQLDALIFPQRLETFVASRDVGEIIVVDRDLGFGSSLQNNQAIAIKFLVNTVDLRNNACDYQYLNNFFLDVDALQANVVGAKRFRLNDQPLMVYQANDLDCNSYTYSDHTSALKRPWLSDQKYYYLYQEDSSEWVFWEKTTVYSSLFTADSGYYDFSFFARGQYGIGQWPLLELRIVDRKDNQILASKKIEVNSSEKSNYHFDFELFEPSSIYLSIGYDNDLQDSENKEDRNVWLYNNSFVIKGTGRNKHDLNTVGGNN